MKKATAISGIIAFILILIGDYLLISKIQPHGGLLVIGFLECWLIFLPLLLICRLKNDKTKFQKITSVLGFVVAWLFLFPGLLFGIMHWPGRSILNLAGMVFGLIFLVLFIVSNKQNIVSAIKGIFTILIAGILIVMAVGREIMQAERLDESQKNIVACEASMINISKQERINHDDYVQLISDTVNHEQLSTVRKLEKSRSEIMSYVNGLRGKLIAFQNGIEPREGDTLSISLIENPSNYDMSTYVMIGPDPANVTGLARPLKEALAKYYDEINKYLPEQSQKEFEKFISPFLPVGITTIDKDGSMTSVSWEQQNFYHKTIIETLTVLQKAELNILKAEDEALRQVQKSTSN